MTKIENAYRLSSAVSLFQIKCSIGVLVNKKEQATHDGHEMEEYSLYFATGEFLAASRMVLLDISVAKAPTHTATLNLWNL
jgi:hypothetical protein